MYTIIELEDNGQDFLKLITDQNGVILDAKPFQKEVWAGGVIPLDFGMLVVGEALPIHKPPHINFGFLKHNVKSIKTVENYDHN
jgi:hypothetical protein